MVAVMSKLNMTDRPPVNLGKMASAFCCPIVKESAMDRTFVNNAHKKIGAGEKEVQE